MTLLTSQAVPGQPGLAGVQELSPLEDQAPVLHALGQPVPGVPTGILQQVPGGLLGPRALRGGLMVLECLVISLGILTDTLVVGLGPGRASRAARAR